MVTYDLNLAARYAQHMIALRDGKIVARGSPGSPLKREWRRVVVDIEAHVIREPRHGSPLCIAYAAP